MAYLSIFQLCILRHTCSKHYLNQNMSSIQKSWIIEIQHGRLYVSFHLSTTTCLACKSFARHFWWYTQKLKCQPDATSTIFINLRHLCTNGLQTEAVHCYALMLRWGIDCVSEDSRNWANCGDTLRPNMWNELASKKNMKEEDSVKSWWKHEHQELFFDILDWISM